MLIGKICYANIKQKKVEVDLIVSEMWFKKRNNIRYKDEHFIMIMVLIYQGDIPTIAIISLYTVGSWTI